MSIGKVRFHAVLTSAALALTACAAGAEKPGASVAAGVNPDVARAVEQSLKPATAEERATANRADPLTRANFWNREFTKDPENLATSIELIRALRGIGSEDRALQIGQQAVVVHPGSYDLLMEVGRTFMSSGKPDEASMAFYRAASLDASRPDALAALGSAYDKSGLHQKAQKAYRQALDISPDRVSTLTNYGLSLALTGDLTAAEASLRKASELSGADAKVRQNLALVLGLQGKFDEMKTVSYDAPADAVAENIRVLEAMVSPTRSYDRLLDSADVGEADIEAAANAPREVTPGTAAPSSPVTAAPMDELGGQSPATKAGSGLRLRKRS